MWASLSCSYTGRAVTLPQLEMVSKDAAVVPRLCVAGGVQGLTFRLLPISAQSAKWALRPLCPCQQQAYHLSTLLKQCGMGRVTALPIYFCYDFNLDLVLYELFYGLDERLHNLLTSLHFCSCTLLAVPCVLQVCVCVHSLQTRAGFHLPEANGQSLTLEMFLFAQIFLRWLLWSEVYHNWDGNSTAPTCSIHSNSDFSCCQTLTSSSWALHSVISQIKGSAVDPSSNVFRALCIWEYCLAVCVSRAQFEALCRAHSLV